jgi:hypothetical protein
MYNTRVAAKRRRLAQSGDGEGPVVATTAAVVAQLPPPVLGAPAPDGSVTGTDGRREWRDAQGLLHRADDLPAVIWPGHYCEWWVHGKRHRTRPEDPHRLYDNGERQWIDAQNRLHRGKDLPALEWPGHLCAWFVHGGLHRQRSEDPHIVCDDGERQWRDAKNRLHRGKDLPAREWPGEYREWWVRGVMKRAHPGDPHILWDDGTKMWCDPVGRLHNDNDLPAVVWPGHYFEWWVHGERRRLRPEDPHRLSESGERSWYDENERLHREGGLPARILADGTEVFYFHGKKYVPVWKPRLFTGVVAEPDVCPICFVDKTDVAVVCAKGGHWVCQACVPTFVGSVSSGTIGMRCPHCNGALADTLVFTTLVAKGGHV